MPTEAPAPPGDRAPRRSFSFRSLPLWLQWVVPFAIAIAVVGGVVFYTHYETTDVNQQVDNYNSPTAEVQENEQDAILVKQQQAPHVFRVAAGLGPGVAARRAVLHYMHVEIGRGIMQGPIKGSTCHRAPGQTSPLVFACRVTASVVTYPFDAVAAPARGIVTYCQVVAAPVPSMKVPVSPRCR